MREFQRCVALGVALNASQTVARLNQNNCPLLGPAFPQPRRVDIEAFRPYAADIAVSIEDILAGRGNHDWLVTNTTSSFSVALWTTKSNESLYEYHFEGSEIRGDGHDVLNNDTLYRIGSISKVFPVYAWLVALGEAHLDEPITKFVPELLELDRQREENSTSNDVDDIRWSDVTPRSLASQMSGIPRDYGLGDYAGFSPSEEELAALGLPALDQVPSPKCAPFTAGQNNECSREEFFRAIRSWHPTAHPYSTPAYSNPAFGILAWALEAIVSDGRTFDEILQESVVSALNMSRTRLSISPGDDVKNGMIPYNATFADWFLSGSFDDPAGNYYSSLSDLNSLGRSILRSALISRPLTNRWLKPITHTPDPYQAVGMPWEIYRYEVPVSKNSEATRLVDAYSKAGDVGSYHTMLLFFPDYNAGLTVLTAGAGTTSLLRIYLTEILTDHLLPALEELGAKEAEELYGGTYVDESTNSSITIELNADRVGLGISKWTSRGTDMLADGQGIKALVGTEQEGKIDLRLQPMDLRDSVAHRIPFRIVLDIEAGLSGTIWSCFSWPSIDGLKYGVLGIDSLVFELDSAGRARSVDLRAFRTVLDRSETR